MKPSQATKPKNSIKAGDIFTLGNSRLACGDSSDPALLRALLGDNKVALTATDPPYGVAVVESKDYLKNPSRHKAIANDQLQSEESYQEFSKKWLDAIVPHLAPKSSFYIFNADKMVFALKKALDQSGYRFCQLLIWVKTGAVIGRMDYLPMHELILYGWKGTHKFVKDQDKSVIVYPKPQKSPLHSTMKPPGLMRRLILNSTSIGENVFDGFLGSGTTLIVSEQVSRRCFGVELSPEYCQVIMDRYAKTFNKKAVFLTNVYDAK